MKSMTNEVSGLPDPLTAVDGTKITNAYDWMNHRRGELLELFQREMYGCPPPRPDSLSFELFESSDHALDGVASRRQYHIRCSMNDGRWHAFDLLLLLPSRASAPVPAFLGLNGLGNQSCLADEEIAITTKWINLGARHPNHVADESTRGIQRDNWSVKKIVQRGYAFATIHSSAVFPDHLDGASDSVHKLFKSESELLDGDRDFGAISAWAWGLSRGLDCLETIPGVNSTRVGVIGHSRLGKAALWAGANDIRFAFAISNNSGCCGASLARHLSGESIDMIMTHFPFWFSSRLNHYRDNERALPFDQHELIALMAPRPAYVASAREDAHADPEGEFLAARHASPVYQLFGAEGLGATDMPTINTGAGEEIGYHIRNGVHDITPLDWDFYLAFADRTQKKSL